MNAWHTEKTLLGSLLGLDKSHTPKNKYRVWIQGIVVDISQAQASVPYITLDDGTGLCYVDVTKSKALKATLGAYILVIGHQKRLSSSSNRKIGFVSSHWGKDLSAGVDRESVWLAEMYCMRRKAATALMRGASKELDLYGSDADEIQSGDESPLI